MLKKNNISVQSTKVFLAYLIVQLLEQKVISLDLLILEKKLKTISKFKFPLNLKQLKTYLGLIRWLCNYILYYTRIAKLL